MERIVAGGALQRARLAWNGAVSARRVLLVGEGHGKFLLPLGKLLPEAKITYVDASAGMLTVARRRLARENPDGLERVDWIHAAVPEWKPPPKSFDFIATNFFLDCFDGAALSRVVESLAGGLVNKGYWLVTDFAVPQTPLMAPLAHACLWIMYRFFRATTHLQASSLESPFPLLATLGFTRIHSREELGGFVTSQLWRLDGANEVSYSG